MPTSYTGNPTATQTPGPTPAANALPVMSLPVGTDALTIESLYQCFKESADFLAWLMQVAGGTRTAKGLSLDATGGTGSVVTAPGGVNATGAGVFGGTLDSANISSSTKGGTTTPTPSTTAGTLYKDTTPFAMGFISANTLAWGVNIATFTHTSAGVYTVTFNTPLTNAIHAVILASPVGVSQIVQGTISTTTTAVLGNTNLAGTAQDNNLYFVVFGS